MEWEIFWCCMFFFVLLSSYFYMLSQSMNCLYIELHGIIFDFDENILRSLSNFNKGPLTIILKFLWRIKNMLELFPKIPNQITIVPLTGTYFWWYWQIMRKCSKWQMLHCWPKLLHIWIVMYERQQTIVQCYFNQVNFNYLLQLWQRMTHLKV